MDEALDIITALLGTCVDKTGSEVITVVNSRAFMDRVRHVAPVVLCASPAQLVPTPNPPAVHHPMSFSLVILEVLFALSL